MTTSKESKRIDTITIRRMGDYDGDSASYLGEYSDTPEDFAIVATGEYEGEFVADLPCECSHLESEHDDEGECLQCRGNDDGCDYFDRVEIPRGRDYRYFNSASVEKENPDADNREYAQQDFKRVQGLNRGDWGFLGVRADAKISIGVNGNSRLMQDITSGGLWGIESDSDDDYLTEVENEQLSELRDQLHALGFSKRAIAAAFRNVERKED